MSTYTLTGAAEFFIYILEEEAEEQLWELWLHKETDHPDDFEKFKAATKKRINKKAKRMSKEQEETAIEKAERILGRKTRTTQEGGS